MNTLSASWTSSEDDAIAALYQAASCQVAWQAALSAASRLFSAVRAQLALLPHAGGIPCLLADVRNEGSAMASNTAPQITLRLPFASASPDTTGVVVSVPVEAGCLALAAFRLCPSRPASEDLAASLRRWADHLRVALRSARCQEQLRRNARLSQTLLEALPQATWILSPERKLVLCNSLATALVMHPESNVRLRDGVFGIRQPAAEQQFRNLVREMSEATTGASAVLDIRADRSRPPQVLHIRREGGPEGQPWSSTQLVVSLFDPSQPAADVATDASRALGLTSAEGRVACLLARGHSVEDIAGLQGTCISTVRTHLAQVFRKLGVARQSDVVRVLSQHQALWRLMGL